MLKVKKLFDDAVLPGVPKYGDAGYDLKVHRIIKEDTYQITYGTGLAIELLSGYHVFLIPRSSISKYSLALANSVGLIDNSYRGEIVVVMNKLPREQHKFYGVGDKFCQLVIFRDVIFPQIEVETLSETNRGEKGFGSSGA